MSLELESYRIVFRGELVYGMSLEEVTDQLRARLKFSEAALSRLFAGKPVVLKRDLDQATAERYANALSSAGAICTVEPMPLPAVGEPERPSAPPVSTASMNCPKCGQGQPEAEICAGCGVVIAKYLQRQEESFIFESGGGLVGNSVATDVMVESLSATKPWVRLVSVLLFIGAGLGLLASLISMLAAGPAPGGSPAMLIGGIQMVACLLYLAPAWYLSRYASALGCFLRDGAVSDLEAALDHQKSFWKFVGVLTLVSMVLAVIGIAAAIMIPVLFMGR